MSNPSRRILIAGNWKMFNGIAASAALARGILDQARIGPRTDVVIAPVSLALGSVSTVLQGSPVRLAAQHAHWETQGAFTGEISCSMLREAGCEFCLVGHSERRTLFHETDADVGRKLPALLFHGVTPIACLGETLAERESGRTFDVVRAQLNAMLSVLDERTLPRIVLAYEPVWAIGTGKTARASDAQLVHAYLRDEIRRHHAELADAVRILYGGSVKAENAAELIAQPDVDGLLVGGASLDPVSFARIIQAAA